MSLSQIWGMTLYEFKMHWRRRALIAATVIFVGLHLVVMLVLKDAVTQLSAGLNVEALGSGDTRNIVPFIWISIYFFLIAVFGPIMTEVVPLDRHYEVHELLQSLPLTRLIYLVGKLLGVFLAVLSSLLIGFVVIGAVAWVALGAYNVGEYLKMWLVGVIPLALLNSGLSMLLASTQPTRRRAAAIGGVFAIFMFLTFTTSVNLTLYGGSASLLDTLNPSRPAVLRYFMPVTGGDGTVLALSSGSGGDVALSLLMGVVELALVGGIMWWWMHRRESVV